MKKNFHIRDMMIYEDSNYIIINKPAHISSLDERFGGKVSILQLLRAYEEKAQLCHRLDKETSGVLIAARNPETYRYVSGLFAKREISKYYHAFVYGVHNFKDYSSDLPLHVTSRGFATVDHKVGKPSETIFNTLKAYRRHSLVECRPITGRLHQIRIHLSRLKAPILSDPNYGGEMFYLSSVKRRFNLKKETEEQPLISRVALHAAAIRFTTESGEEISAEAPYPKDLRALKKQLDSHDL